MKVLAFGASTSSQSINRQLANFAASQIPDAVVTDLDLRSLDLPIYSADEEETNGPPQDAQKFVDAIQEHDILVVSLAEHNGSYTAAFKNLYDWASRIEQKVWAGKPMLLLATSPGGRGGASVLETGEAKFSRMGADIRATLSLGSFYDNFDSEKGVTDDDFVAKLQNAIEKLTA
jgi:NAD(P)H-dependent FMN reductase